MVRSICVNRHNFQRNVQTENMWAYSILRFGLILPFNVFMCFGTLVILCFEGWGLYMFGRVTAESTIALIQNFTVTNMIFETILMFCWIGIIIMILLQLTMIGRFIRRFRS